MKKIWKRPGTAAFERSLRKSINRMATDIIRVPESKLEQARLNYLKNKPGGLKGLMRIDKRLSRAVVKKALKLNDIEKENNHLEAQSRAIANGIKLLEKNFGSGDCIKKTRQLRTAAEQILQNCRARGKNLEILEKTLPKKDAKKAKEIRKTGQKAEKELLEKISEIDGLLVEMQEGK